MPSFAESVRANPALGTADVATLQRLVTDWHLLADLSFADLLLWVAQPGPDDGPGAEPRAFRVVAQARPTTGPTAYSDDMVGHQATAAELPLVASALRAGRVVRDGDPQWRDRVPVRLEAIPVRSGGRVIAVIARSTNMIGIRMPSRLELSYLQAASDLSTMISEGTFPPKDSRTDLSRLPRIGDGLVRLDPAGVITYVSPNALSAYRRFGFAGNLLGSHLGRVTAQLAPSGSPTDEALAAMVSGEAFRATEIDSVDGTLVIRTLPLLRAGERIGALVLIRDVTDLRSRERELMSKDATIREIHHRVKNNLQTVAALLRLQSRRVKAVEARTALDEAVRRVGSIAVVHEMLSQGVEDRLDFDHVADRLLGLVADVSAPEATVTPIRTGHFGEIPAETATPLALVLTELLHNAVEHGLQNRPGALMLGIRRYRDGQLLGRGGVVPSVGRPGAAGGDQSRAALNGAGQNGAGQNGAGQKGVGQDSAGQSGAGQDSAGQSGAGETGVVAVNAVDALPDEEPPPALRAVGFGTDLIRIEVEDDGQGLPEGFDLASSGSLGLQIVRSLVSGELKGHIEIAARRGGGTRVLLEFPTASI